MTELSDDPRDKLHAALNHAYPDADEDLGPAYRTACQLWFDQLTEGERWITVTATVAYEKGDEDRAREIASQLPPAPVFPLP
jgi:hypothetical protein